MERNKSDNSTEVDDLVRLCNEAINITRTAHRNKKSLSGDNFYGQKFHNAVVRLRTAQARLTKSFPPAGVAADVAEQLGNDLDTICSPSGSVKEKVAAVKQLTLQLETIVHPALKAMGANPVPLTEQVLPLKVVANTRTYFERVITQANGCYEHQWYDACSVMIRRFVETLIVELYEAKSKAAQIQDGNGDFFMLQVLIDRTLADSDWNLSRETKRTLPLIKKLGDRSAHNRRYVATKNDVDTIIPGLRVVADDLLHLAGIK